MGLGRDIIVAVSTHYKKLRAHLLFKDATIVYIMENNLGMEHNWIAEVIESSTLFNNVAILQEHEGQLGFHTTAQSKIRNDDMLREKISFNSILFLDNIVSTNVDPGRCGAAAKNILVDQLAGMCEYVKQKPDGTATRYITSIYNELFQRIKGKKDDIQRALSMLVWVTTLFVARDPRLAIDYKRISKLREKRFTEGARAARDFVFVAAEPKRHVNLHRDPALPPLKVGGRRFAPEGGVEADEGPSGRQAKRMRY